MFNICWGLLCLFGIKCMTWQIKFRVTSKFFYFILCMRVYMGYINYNVIRSTHIQKKLHTKYKV